MTDDDKALVERLRDFVIAEDIDLAADRIEALTAENERLIEQHEAFRQEVSDAVTYHWPTGKAPPYLTRFIITKPDPLVEVMNEWWNSDGYASIETLRAALAKRGLEIREKSE